MSKIKELETLFTLLRRKMPYGFMKTSTGKTVFFNREYEILSICGIKEFAPLELKPSTFLSEVKGRMLLGEDGSVYVGTFYFLYDGGNSPFMFKNLNLLQSYFHRLSTILSQYVESIGNAYNKRTYTPSQRKKATRLLNNED